MQQRLSLRLSRTARRSFWAISNMEPKSLQDDGVSCAHAEEGAQAQEHSWVHYQHDDGLDPYRWTAKESHQYLENRPWEQVLKFYSLVAAGKLSLSDLIFHGQPHYAGSERAFCAKDRVNTVPVPWASEDTPKDPPKKLKGGKWDRKTFKIVVSYDGSAFAGWQKQPGLYTVQGLLEQALGSYSDGKRVASLKLEGLNVDAAVVVAGRTDKGVHAAGQVCSFYTWRSSITPQEIKTSINSLEPKALRAISVNEVSRTFHPNFSARWRRYVYILPLNNTECPSQQNDRDFGNSVKPKIFDVMTVNAMLSKLEGQQLSYTVFARDTKTSRSRGPPTECFVYHARAAIAELPLMEQDSSQERSKVMCVELVANRFLRKMVRVLVATSIREAAAGASSNTLVRLTGASCRRASASPAPACGLCLTEVNYGDFPGANLLIKRDFSTEAQSEC